MTILNILFLYIGLGGMAAGIYHDSLPLTVTMAALFIAGHRYFYFVPTSVTIITPNQIETNDKDDVQQ